MANDLDFLGAQAAEGSKPVGDTTDSPCVGEPFRIPHATQAPHATHAGQHRQHAGERGDPISPAAPSPLTAEQFGQIARAQEQRKKINRAQKVANFNAWSFSVFAGFSLLFGLLSPGSLIAGAALAGLAYNEFRGRRQLMQLDRRGPRTLGNNQIVCCVLLTLYCGYQMYRAYTGPGIDDPAIQQSAELSAMLEPMQDLIKTVTIGAYAVILVVGLAVQGATAWYYFSRKRWLDDYLRQTPGWVIELDRVQAASAA